MKLTSTSNSTLHQLAYSLAERRENLHHLGRPSKSSIIFHVVWTVGTLIKKSILTLLQQILDAFIDVCHPLCLLCGCGGVDCERLAWTDNLPSVS